MKYAALLSVQVLVLGSLAAVARDPVSHLSTRFAENETIVIDAFENLTVNALGFFHGPALGSSFGKFETADGKNYLEISTDDIDAGFVSGLAETCGDFTSLEDHYIHVEYAGSAKFSISLQQHNLACDDARLPFPETWDSVQAERYSTGNGHDIYVPLSHFQIDLRRVLGIALEDWYTNTTTKVFKIEIVPSAAVPVEMRSISKLPTGRMSLGCANPNHIAFGIDDGVPEYLQQIIHIIKEEQIPVTFFVQGQALKYDVEDGNFTAAYREMKDLGHQIGLHTLTHPHMEHLQTDEEINAEIRQNLDLVKEELGVDTRYFRPPYGTIGARTRQALGRYISDPEIIMWSIDVADWLYGVQPGGDPGRMQFNSFAESLDKGGSLVVMHYLYESTVEQFRDMIHLARSKGRQFVRVDQCIGDPDAPKTWGWPQ